MKKILFVVVIFFMFSVFVNADIPDIPFKLDGYNWLDFNDTQKTFYIIGAFSFINAIDLAFLGSPHDNEAVNEYVIDILNYFSTDYAIYELIEKIDSFYELEENLDLVIVTAYLLVNDSDLWFKAR